MRPQVSLAAVILVMAGVTGSAQQQPAQRLGFPTAPAGATIPADEGVLQGPHCR